MELPAPILTSLRFSICANGYGGVNEWRWGQQSRQYR